MLKKLRENWFFIRQDLVSYGMSTLLHLILCLFTKFSWWSILYGLFDCIVFYVPFWYIRINFAKTYHSDNWNHCKMWTRIMLCSGTFVLWLLPVKYSLFNGLFVALICNIVLYLVAIETDEKKRLKIENNKLLEEIETLLAKLEDPKTKILKICEDECISERDTKIAIMYYIDRMKPKQIWEWLMDTREDMEYGSVYRLLNRLNHKIKSKL